MKFLKEYGALILDLAVLILWLLVWLGAVTININTLAAYFAARTLFRIQDTLRERNLKKRESSVE